MKGRIFIFCNPIFNRFFKHVFNEYETLNFSSQKNLKSELKNENILLVLDKSFSDIFSEALLLDNNVVILSSYDEANISKQLNARVLNFYQPTQFKKFLNITKGFFIMTPILFMDIKILGETISNQNTNLSCSLTTLEKKILTELIVKMKINRFDLLENVLGLKKNIETKTIESHLTRIRKKLLTIKDILVLVYDIKTIFLKPIA